jgi:hypothetical protein
MENATADLLLISYIFLNNHSKDCVKNVIHISDSISIPYGCVVCMANGCNQCCGSEMVSMRIRIQLVTPMLIRIWNQEANQILVKLFSHLKFNFSMKTLNM